MKKVREDFDECGIQYKSLPKRSYVHTGTVVKAKKPVKDQLTVLVGTTMDGHKFKPVVEEKYQHPCGLRGVSRDTLPVHYYPSPSAWMTSEISEHS